MRFCLPVVLCFVACSGDKDDSTDTDTGFASDADTDTDSDSDTDTDTDIDDSLAIAGSYTDVYGSDHELTDTLWATAYPGYSPDAYNIAQYSNKMRFVIAQNDAANYFNPELWSRFDWAWAGSDLYYCQTGYDLATENDAEALPAADASDPATEGCGVSSWTLLTP